MTKATSKQPAKPVKQTKTARAKQAAPKALEKAPVEVPEEAPEEARVAAPAAPPPQTAPQETAEAQTVQAAAEAPAQPQPTPYPDPTLTAAPPQHQVPHVDPPSVEPDTSAQTSVVNQAMDVIAASDSQQNSIRRAFELQRATIAHGVKERRDAATQEMAATKAAYQQQKGNYPMNQQQGQMGYGAGPQAQPGMPGQQLSTNQILAQEFAETIRGMIAQEVDKQLKALLSVYTANQNAQAQEQATPQPQQAQQQAPQAYPQGPVT